jgi:hypothetical protein
MEQLSEKLETILSHEESNEDSDNFNKILELEQNKIKEESKDKNIVKKYNIKEISLLLFLSIILNNNHFDNLLKKIPNLTNEYIIIILKSIIFTFIYFFTKIIIV